MDQEEYAMKRYAVLAGWLILGLTAFTAKAEDQTGAVARISAAIDSSAAPDKLKAFAKTTLLPLTTNAVLIKETKAQNEKNMPDAEIQKIDKDWQAAEDELPIQKEKLSNAVAEELKKFAAAHPSVIEVFAMDNKGGVVGENKLTSDYWQGDEEKWTGSYAGGKGGVDVGKLKFDKSANANLQQISLPLIAEDGSIVGAITFGVAVEKL